MAVRSVEILRRLVQLWVLYARIDASWLLRDTKYFIITIVSDLIFNISALSGMFLLSERFNGIGSMSRDEILFMLGYASIASGVFGMFMNMCNVGHISRRIGRGQIDHMLIQPLPIWMQLATEGFIPVSGGGILVTGIFIMWYAASKIHLVISFGWVALFIGSLISSVAIVVSISYIVGSAAFYAPVAGEEISTTAIDLFESLKVFPLGGLSHGAQVILTVAVPVGLSAWFPAEILLGSKPLSIPMLSGPISALLLAVAASIIFRKGLKHYAKCGSTRYLDRGHRR